MPPVAFALALAAAFVHAGWNLLLGRARDSEAATSAAMLGLLLGLAVGTCIAGYTLVDKSGLQHASPLPYLELVTAGPALGYFVLVARRSGIGSVRHALDRSSALAGVGFVGAYGLVLLALTRSPAAPVAAVRETSVVILTIMSALWLRETISRRQWLAVVVIVVGIATLALG